MRDQSLINDVRRMAGMPPLSTDEGVKMFLEDVDQALERHDRGQRKAERTIAAAAARAGFSREYVALSQAVAAGQRGDPEQQVRDGIKRAMGSARTPLAEALLSGVAKVDTEVEALWPGVRNHLIAAGRKLVEASPKIDRATIVRYYADALPKIFRALDLDGLDVDKEVSELTDLALAISPLVDGKQAKQPVAPDGQPLENVRLVALSNDSAPLCRATKDGRPYFGPVYMSHHAPGGR